MYLRAYFKTLNMAFRQIKLIVSIDVLKVQGGPLQLTVLKGSWDYNQHTVFNTCRNELYK